jgi:hypothetical protein
MAQGSIVKRGNTYYIVYRFGGKEKWERIGLSRRVPSIQTTLDRYGHLMPESHREAGERLDEFVFGEASTQRKTEAIAAAVGGEKCDFAKECESSTKPATGRYESFVSKMLAKRPKSCQIPKSTQKCKSPKLVKSQGLTRW